jgi:cell division protein FtsZ
MVDPTAETQPTQTSKLIPSLKVVGLGGGGSNAVNRMIELGMGGVEFIVANTDQQALEASLAKTRIQLGPKLTRGMGAGGNPQVGFRAAQESREALADAIRGADMLFLTAGMGGGSGTGAASVVAEIARGLDIVTIAVVTMPFSFEMGQRQANATEGLAQLRPHTDTLIAIPNDRLLQIAPADLPIETAFRLADDVLRQAVQGITELVTQPGLINVDFAHIRTMMKKGGGSLMAIGHGRGETKALDAIEQALHHPLLDEISLNNVSGVVANFSGGDDLSLFEIGDAVSELHNMAGHDIDLVLGISSDSRMANRAQVILVMTGIGAQRLEEVMGIGAASVAAGRMRAGSPAPRESVPVFAGARGGQTVDIDDLDLPAFMRRRSQLNGRG